MNVAFISHSAKLGGAERSLLDLVVGAKSHNIQSTVVLPRTGPLATELKINNIHVIVHPYHNWLGRNNRIIKGLYSFLINIVMVPYLARKLKTGNFDLIYSNSIATPVGALVAKAIKVKHIWHIREFVQEDMGASFDYGNNRTMRFVASNTSHFIYNSHAVKNKFAPFLNKISGTVVYNGLLVGKPNLATRRRKLEKHKLIKLCLVGGLHSGKGQHQAIEALAILQKVYPLIEIEIVGDGDQTYIRSLHTLIEMYKLSTHVRFTGFAIDVASTYKYADIALVCSRNEAFGRVVVEAMAEGCPVIASRSGGIPEIIEHGVSGLMYESENIEDLAKQISRLINDTDLYSNISHRGITDVYKRFSRQRYVEEIYKIIEKLCT